MNLKLKWKNDDEYKGFLMGFVSCYLISLIAQIVIC